MTRGARFGKCQWISGKPSFKDSCKCGAETGASRVSCPEHEARARLRRKRPAAEE